MDWRSIRLVLAECFITLTVGCLGAWLGDHYLRRATEQEFAAYEWYGDFVTLTMTILGITAGGIIGAGLLHRRARAGRKQR